MLIPGMSQSVSGPAPGRQASQEAFLSPAPRNTFHPKLEDLTFVRTK